MEQLFFAGKVDLKINSLVKTPLHEFMAVERSGLWAPGRVPRGMGKMKCQLKSYLSELDTGKLQNHFKTANS